MTKTEIINKIEEIENKMFALKMKDHWTNEDFATNEKWVEEIKTLKTMVETENEYIVEFIKPLKKDFNERVVTIGTFNDVEKAEAFGHNYQMNNNTNETRVNRGYYTIKTIEKK